MKNSQIYKNNWQSNIHSLLNKKVNVLKSIIICNRKYIILKLISSNLMMEVIKKE